jgi:hypothetical protein
VMLIIHRVAVTTYIAFRQTLLHSAAVFKLYTAVKYANTFLRPFDSVYCRSFVESTQAVLLGACVFCTF